MLRAEVGEGLRERYDKSDQNEPQILTNITHFDPIVLARLLLPHPRYRRQRLRRHPRPQWYALAHCSHILLSVAVDVQEVVFVAFYCGWLPHRCEAGGPARSAAFANANRNARAFLFIFRNGLDGRYDFTRGWCVARRQRRRPWPPSLCTHLGANVLDRSYRVRPLRKRDIPAHLISSRRQAGYGPCRTGPSVLRSPLDLCLLHHSYRHRPYSRFLRQTVQVCRISPSYAA